MHDLLQHLVQWRLLPLGSVEFVSVEFALSLPLFLPLYWACGHSFRAQNGLLLAASLGWLLLLNPLFALVLVLYSGLIVATAAGLHRAVQSAAHDPEAGRPWLLAGIAFALVHLALYKYAGAFRSLMPPAFQSGTARILMPLGLSYYTLQSLSYLVALYRRRIRPWPWYEVPLYLAFFPTVSAGPIWRADSMESIAGEGWAADPQLHSPRQPVRPALAFGLLFLGLLKIWWLAATLNDGFVEPVFANPDSFDSFSILLAIYGYTAQLYLNFSGHADLAIGTAMLLGFRLPPNFAAPFFAHNLREFWRRWHISLSTWIRDYVYIPLGGSHAGFRRTQLNVILAMCLSGLWHGSGWCFFLWGLLHGLGLVALNLGDAFFDRRDALAETWPGRALGILCTLSFVAFAFLVFRSETLDEVVGVLAALLAHVAVLPPLGSVIAALLLLLALLSWPLWQMLFRGLVCLLEEMPMLLWCLPLGLLAFFLLIVAPSGVPGFIYATF